MILGQFGTGDLVRGILETGRMHQCSLMETRIWGYRRRLQEISPGFSLYPSLGVKKGFHSFYPVACQDLLLHLILGRQESWAFVE